MWKVKSEAFLQHVNWVNDLSLSVSYGRTGNAGLGSWYESLGLVGAGPKYNGKAGWVIGDARVSTALATNCAIGGSYYELNDEDDEWEPKSLPSSTIYNYLYASGKNTDWTGTDNHDGVTHLSTKPSITLAPAQE